MTNINGMEFTPTTVNSPRINAVLVAVMVATTTLATTAANPPADPAHAQHQSSSATVDSSLNDQLSELRAKVARLEAALDGPHVRHPAVSPPPGMASSGPSGMNMGAGGSGMGMGVSPTPGTSADGGMSGMGMSKMPGMMSMDNMAGGSDSMPDMNMPAQGVTGGAMSDMMMRNMGGMGMMNMSGMEKMRKMGMMGGMKGMSMPSALPGFPGASHLYHIGATGYFLDHPEHITLSIEQQVALNQVQEQAELKQASLERKIAEGEQELWVLTGSDQPDVGKIEAKIREIEQLRGDQRLAFIRSVGEAANVLTENQRRALTGLIEQPTGLPGTDPQRATLPGK